MTKAFEFKGILFEPDTVFSYTFVLHTAWGSNNFDLMFFLKKETKTKVKWTTVKDGQLTVIYILTAFCVNVHTNLSIYKKIPQI